MSSPKRNGFWLPGLLVGQQLVRECAPSLYQGSGPAATTSPPCSAMRAFERESGLPTQIIKRRLQEHQDLGDGVERERLERGGKRAELLDRGVRPAATVASVWP